MFNNRYRYLFILLLALYTFANTLLCQVYHYFDIEIEWYFALFTIILVTALTFEGSRILEPRLIKWLPRKTSGIRFLIWFFIAGNVVAFLAAATAVYLVGILITNTPWSRNINPLKLNIIYAVLVNLFLHLLNGIFFYFREYRKHWAEAEELRRITEQAQLQLIRNQINPHFLFNNLNVLSGMVIRDYPKANQFIEEFAKVYRYVLGNQEKEAVTLRQELEFIRSYVYLLNVRFGSGIVVEISTTSESLDLYIIPVALQMLLENAIKHNSVSDTKPLTVRIYSVENSSIIIRNNIQLRQVIEPSSQIGLENIRKRYELLTGIQIEVNHTPDLFEVHLPLLTINQTMESYEDSHH